MTVHKLDNSKAKDLFEPESKEVEALPVFKLLKAKMESLGWVYEGSLRWSRHQQLMRVVYKPGESAVMELWHTDGITELTKRVGTDCDDDGMNDALKELRID